MPSHNRVPAGGGPAPLTTRKQLQLVTRSFSRTFTARPLLDHGEGATAPATATTAAQAATAVVTLHHHHRHHPGDPQEWNGPCPPAPSPPPGRPSWQPAGREVRETFSPSSTGGMAGRGQRTKRRYLTSDIHLCTLICFTLTMPDK